MIPYEPWKSHIIWFHEWRRKIAKTKQDPRTAFVFANDAMRLQANYLIDLAFDLNILHKRKL